MHSVTHGNDTDGDGVDDDDDDKEANAVAAIKNQDYGFAKFIEHCLASCRRLWQVITSTLHRPASANLNFINTKRIKRNRRTVRRCGPFGWSEYCKEFINVRWIGGVAITTTTTTVSTEKSNEVVTAPNNSVSKRMDARVSIRDSRARITTTTLFKKNQ